MEQTDSKPTFTGYFLEKQVTLESEIDVAKCATNYVSSFEVYVSFKGQNILKL